MLIAAGAIGFALLQADARAQDPLAGVGAQAGRHSLGLAAHCVDDTVGQPVRDAAANVFGHVAMSAWPYDSHADDYAFVEIDPASHSRVDPALAGHPAIPTAEVRAAAEGPPQAPPPAVAAPAGAHDRRRRAAGRGPARGADSSSQRSEWAGAAGAA